MPDTKPTDTAPRYRNPDAGYLTQDQIGMLAQPISMHRVMVANGQSHLPQQDVLAHLNRIFGFGRWSTTLMELVLIGHSVTPGNGNNEKHTVIYRATMRLEVRDQHGKYLAHWDDVSTGSAINQRSADAAHDLALKSAVSLAKKRCAIALGDQFGLSLYNRGQTDALVQWSLNQPADADAQVFWSNGGTSPMDAVSGVTYSKPEGFGIDENYYATTTNGALVDMNEEQRRQAEHSLGMQTGGPDLSQQGPPVDAEPSA